MTPIYDISEIAVKINPFADICMHCPKKDCGYVDYKMCDFYVLKAYALISNGITPKPGTLEAEDPKFVEKILYAHDHIEERKEKVRAKARRHYDRQKEKEKKDG